MRLQRIGGLVAIDAMGTHTKIAEAILARGANALLALKDDQRSLAEGVALSFDSPERHGLVTLETTDDDPGRIETRRHWVSHDVAWLDGDRRAPGAPRFPGLRAQAGTAQTVLDRGGNHLFALKDIRPAMPREVAAFCGDPPEPLETFVTKRGHQLAPLPRVLQRGKVVQKRWSEHADTCRT